ncbi:MAG: hypothetical protein NTW03_00965 [Verrucomicrobia bacterium]|nr:hypothetical protein [Verrucomicrobiota bacterium]
MTLCQKQGGLDGPLASMVEDDYHQWATNPRFGDWQTRPAMRAGVGVIK